MLLQASSRQCAWVPKRWLRLRWTPHEAEHHVSQRGKMYARAVLKSRKGEGSTCVGPEVSDRLDCCRNSGKYGTAIQRDLLPVEVSLSMVCSRRDIVRAPRSASKSVADLDVWYVLPDFQLLLHVGDRCTDVDY
jgi:hypothetical protein